MKTIATLIAATALVAGASSLANAQAYEQVANPHLSEKNIQTSDDLGVAQPFYPLPAETGALVTGRSVAVDGQLVAPVAGYSVR